MSFHNAFNTVAYALGDRWDIIEPWMASVCMKKKIIGLGIVDRRGEFRSYRFSTDCPLSYGSKLIIPPLR